jgi:transposase
LRQALTGRFSDHHAFLISQALAELDNLEESMSALAARIEQHLGPFAQELELLSTIPGVKRVAATAILSEIGTSMSCFPSTGHLDSWAGMALGNHESAGKRRRAKARKGNRWLRTILVECGQAAGKTRNTALAAIYRRMIIRGGRKHAAFVVGRHILNIAYHLLAERHLSGARSEPLRTAARRAAQTSLPRPTPSPWLPSHPNPAPEGCMKCSTQHEVTFSEQADIFNCSRPRPRRQTGCREKVPLPKCAPPKSTRDISFISNAWVSFSPN